MPPRGHYLAAEVGRLAGVSGNKIGQWARRGYIRSSQSEDTPRIYSYQDVAEAMFVHELELMHVPHKEIRGTIQSLRKEHGYSWPLSNADLLVTVAPDSADGKPTPAHVLVRGDVRFVRPARSMDAGLLTMEVDTVAIDGALRRGGWITRELPDLEHIEIHPDRLSGRPTIRDRRVPAEDIARLALESENWDEIRDGYDLTNDQIRDAVRWWQRVEEYSAAA